MYLLFRQAYSSIQFANEVMMATTQAEQEKANKNREKNYNLLPYLELDMDSVIMANASHILEIDSAIKECDRDIRELVSKREYFVKSHCWIEDSLMLKNYLRELDFLFTKKVVYSKSFIEGNRELNDNLKIREEKIKFKGGSIEI
jgi:hypothetical protein